ncbi:hypothetical protein ABFU47_13340 [Xanthomonas campestris pv. raphani]|uniref:hypothetical protein n=1 Tax=Xanthomonas campestris TaxID=339 RepID=UPI002B23C704|nr:hypothetical protein [Xanthomonas campestris]MEA9675884.1 hypothetical protein [Xanthomonas campestris pv. raphani]
MTDMHPNDMPAPLDWTLNHALESADSDVLMWLTHVPAPQELRSETLAVAGGSHPFNFPALQQFTYAEPHAYIALRLRNARRKLRDRLDEIDLAAMGVTA